MATPTRRGAVLAARTIKAHQVRSLATHTHSAPTTNSSNAVATLDAVTPDAVTPAQRKMVKRIAKVRTDQITMLLRDLKFYGPMPAPSDSTVPQPTQLMNPFLPRKSLKTGRWHSPLYSLRRQADLAKMALKTGNLDKLPPGPKTTALKDRIARVEKSLSQADVQRLQQSVVPVSLPPPQTTVPRQLAKAQRVAERLKESIKKREERLTATQEEFGITLASEEALGGAAKRAQQEAAELREVTAHITALQKDLSARMRVRQKAHAVRLEKFNMPVEWVGKLPKAKKGAELGTRLYARKKVMFKGHAWERRRAKRVKKQARLMRHMAARVANYKDYYKKRRPNPLKPSRYTKPPKLPF